VDLIRLCLLAAIAGCVLPPAAEPTPVPWGPAPAGSPGAQPAAEATVDPYGEEPYAEEPYAEAMVAEEEYPDDEVTPATPQPATSTVPAGRWVSTEWASYTNAAMVSADFYLTITLDETGRFSGSWGRYVCLTQTYGIWSCGFDRLEGTATGTLAPDGTGVIDLERVGRSALVWRAKSTTELALELPRDWQDGVLFRSSVKR
jgi:hypothetical protein